MWLHSVRVVDGVEAVKTNPEVQVAPDKLPLIAVQWDAAGLLVVHEWDQRYGGAGDGRHGLHGYNVHNTHHRLRHQTVYLYCRAQNSCLYQDIFRSLCRNVLHAEFSITVLLQKSEHSQHALSDAMTTTNHCFEPRTVCMCMCGG